MAQVQMTVSLDSQIQQQIDRYCALSGLTKNAAFDEMISRWNRMFWIPTDEIFNDKDDVVFYAKEGAYVVTGNKRYFPETPIVVTLTEMVKILEDAGLIEKIGQQ